MIQIDRGRSPEVLQSNRWLPIRARLWEFYMQPIERRQQQTFDLSRFQRNPHFTEVKASLQTAFMSKCAFCESHIGPSSYGDISHFRPTRGAIRLDGTFDDEFYWWLTYCWENLHYSCAVCNRSKGRRFPIQSSVGTESLYQRVSSMPIEAFIFAYDLLRSVEGEERLLLDPCEDNPEESFLYNDKGLIEGRSEGAKVTIDVFDLNRIALVQARGKEVTAMLEALAMVHKPGNAQSDWILPMVRSLERTLEHNSPYLGIKRQFVRAWVRNNKLPNHLNFISDIVPGLQTNEVVNVKQQQKAAQTFRDRREDTETYSLEDDNKSEDYYRRTRLVERVEIENFKAIRNLTIDFTESDNVNAPWFMLLGENGTGKSTILQAIALTLASKQDRDALGLDAERFVRYRCKRGNVKVYLSGNRKPLELHFRVGNHSFEGVTQQPKILVVAYGATRLLPNRSHVPVNSNSAASQIRNLFDSFAPLRDAEAWLYNLPTEQFEIMARSIKQLLLLDEGGIFIKNTDSRRVDLKIGTHTARIEDLSDGYRSMIGFAADIMGLMMIHWKAPEVAEGLVLLDEIGAHMHPRWKMLIVQRLRQVFPRLQFITTTHDPLCLRGIHKNEVGVVSRGDNNSVCLERDLPDPSGLRVEQILTSDFFGLMSTVDPEIDAEMREYYDLLSKQRLSSSESKRMDELTENLNYHNLLGDTPRQQILLQAIDESLAKSESVTRVSEELRPHLTSLWEKATQDISGE